MAVQYQNGIRFWLLSPGCYTAIAASGKKYWIKGSTRDGYWDIQDPETRKYTVQALPTRKECLEALKGL